MMRESKVGVGVIGVGGISSHVHLPGLRLSPHAEIVALCDSDSARLSQQARAYGVAHTFSAHEELLQDPAVDAVIIATPTFLHAPIALAALAAGKHVDSETCMEFHHDASPACVIPCPFPNNR